MNKRCENNDRCWTQTTHGRDDGDDGETGMVIRGDNDGSDDDDNDNSTVRKAEEKREVGWSEGDADNSDN